MKDYTSAMSLWAGDVILSTEDTATRGDEAPEPGEAGRVIQAARDAGQDDEGWEGYVVVRIEDKRGATQDWLFPTSAWVEVRDRHVSQLQWVRR